MAKRLTEAQLTSRENKERNSCLVAASASSTSACEEAFKVVKAARLISDDDIRRTNTQVVCKGVRGNFGLHA